MALYTSRTSASQVLPAVASALIVLLISAIFAALSFSSTPFKADVRDVYKANQYLLFIYERFNDIRLVGTPPQSIGKFGGDTDNWEWPRQTGDFSVFRVFKLRLALLIFNLSFFIFSVNAQTFTAIPTDSIIPDYSNAKAFTFSVSSLDS